MGLFVLQDKNFKNLFCTFSRLYITLLLLGDQIIDPYIKVDLTNELYNWVKSEIFLIALHLNFK